MEIETGGAIPQFNIGHAYYSRYFRFTFGGVVNPHLVQRPSCIAHAIFPVKVESRGSYLPGQHLEIMNYPNITIADVYPFVGVATYR